MRETIKYVSNTALSTELYTNFCSRIDKKFTAVLLHLILGNQARSSLIIPIKRNIITRRNAMYK